MAAEGMSISYGLKLYAADIGVLVLMAIISIILEIIPPVERKFFIDDPSIQYPYSETEYIPSWMLPFINMGIPSLIVLGWVGIKWRQNKRLLVAFLGLYFSVCLAFLFTNSFKGTVGRLRPDFLDRCKPQLELRPGVVTCIAGSEKLVAEGRRSFPSGHASSTFGGMVFAALFTAGQIKMLDGKAYLHKFLIFVAPIIMAILVSVSRIVDYRHHWSDVLAGSIIGILAGTCGYFFYFPGLCSKMCDEPRPGRFDEFDETQGLNSAEFRNV